MNSFACCPIARRIPGSISTTGELFARQCRTRSGVRADRAAAAITSGVVFTPSVRDAGTPEKYAAPPREDPQWSDASRLIDARHSALRPCARRGRRYALAGIRFFQRSAQRSGGRSGIFTLAACIHASTLTTIDSYAAIGIRWAGAFGWQAKQLLARWLRCLRRPLRRRLTSWTNLRKELAGVAPART